jgi:hypothetical protein
MKTGNPVTYGLLVVFSALSFLSAFAGQVPVEELTKWNFYGMGSGKVERGMFYMKEARDSKGVMIVSPEVYGENLTVRYQVMPMSAASVCVVILSASDSGDGKALTLPSGYDGAMGHWIQHVRNYFFAFHNAAHNATLFALFSKSASSGIASEKRNQHGKSGS